jgi:hypothetical protein
MKKINKKTQRIIILVLGIILLLGAVYFLTMNPRRGVVKRADPSLPLDHVLTQQEAARDLAYFYNHLKSRHPVWLDGPEQLVQAVESQYQTEVEQLDEQVTVLELWQASGRIAAELGDGHTWVTWNDPQTPLYIDSFKQINDYGAPIAINDVPTDEIRDNFLSQIPVEMQSYAEATFLKNVIISESLLTFSGVDTGDGVSMTYQTDEGEQTFHYGFVPIQNVIKYANYVTDDEWVGYAIDQEQDVGIFTLRSCVFNEEYQETLDSFFSEVFDSSISNVIVDLRGNGGGNSTVANEFLKYIDVDTYRTWDSDIRLGWYLLRYRDKVINNPQKPETFAGDLYVLTDTFTYSAAMDFAMLIGDNDLGTLVGEPSGNLPGSYGDILFFQMPNSDLVVRISYKKWYRIDVEKAQEALEPDVVVPAEEALDKALELIAN